MQLQMPSSPGRQGLPENLIPPPIADTPAKFFHFLAAVSSHCLIINHRFQLRKSLSTPPHEQGCRSELVATGQDTFGAAIIVIMKKYRRHKFQLHNCLLLCGSGYLCTPPLFSSSRCWKVPLEGDLRSLGSAGFLPLDAAIRYVILYNEMVAMPIGNRD